MSGPDDDATQLDNDHQDPPPGRGDATPTDPLTADRFGAPTDGAPTRAGFAALIGAPNAGKSTLINHIVGAKVSIVTHKVQTTRTRIRGICMVGAAQLILIDTPGIFAPKRRLDRAMVDAAWTGAQEADVVALLVDVVRGVDEEVERILEGLPKLRQPVVLVLNKVDKIDKGKLLERTAEITSRHDFAETFMISALSGSGVATVVKALAERLPLGPWLFPPDDLSDAPMRFMAAEVTREKIYLRLHQELPYISTVETTDWRQLPPKKGEVKGVRIEQTIYVERETQRQIVLGKGGRAIKQISMEARNEIAEMIDQPVHLFLFVKVRENWGRDPERFAEMGLEFPKD